MVISNDEPDTDIDVGGGGDPSAPPIVTAVPASAAAFNPNKNIERTTNADGSLVVKATTTTRQISPTPFRLLLLPFCPCFRVLEQQQGRLELE